MKVGLLAPRLSPNTGGGYTFVEMIVRAVGHFDLGVEMVNLDYEAIFDPPAPASRRRGANFLAELKRAGGTIRNPSDRAELRGNATPLSSTSRSAHKMWICSGSPRRLRADLSPAFLTR